MKLSRSVLVGAIAIAFAANCSASATRPIHAQGYRPHTQGGAGGQVIPPDALLMAQFCAPGQACTIVGTMLPGVAYVDVFGGDAGNVIDSMRSVRLTGNCPFVTPDGQPVGICPFSATTPAIPGVRWVAYRAVGSSVDIAATYCVGLPGE